MRNESSMRSAWKHLRTWAVSLLLLSLMACGGDEPTQEVVTVRPVKMFTVGGATGIQTLEYPGTVAASQDAQIGFEVPGRIVELPVSEGQMVEKGAILARLDARDFQTAVDAEKARKELARADYNRYRELYVEDAVSQQELEVKRHNFAVADANWKTSRKALEDTYLRAPFAGQVARKLVDDFANVQAKQPVLLLQDASDLEVVVAVPEADWARAKPGLTLAERTARMQPRVVVSSLPDRSFPASLKEFSTAADPVTRTYEARIAFEKPDDVMIQAGMTAKVIVTIPDDAKAGGGGLSVPSSAVAADENGDAYVWIVNEAEMTVSRAPVTLGDLSGSEVEILEGLSAGDAIAVSGVHHLRDGMAVSRLSE